ncbi:hypothetical protein [Flavobacterium sp.]|uniref:hypothetical protein n=1 Tax=Flavobacterium sp. TaxID=239 RepID=UPI002637CCD1|nr:hypothetical protein [Flavobacterium sp.]
MKKLYLFTFLIIAAVSYSQADCSKFRNGTFKFTDPESKKVCIIDRDGDTQTERVENSDEVYEFRVTWTDSCTYTISPTSSTIQKKPEVLKLGTMTVNITPVTDTTYIQLIRVANSPKFKRRDEVVAVSGL